MSHVTADIIEYVGNAPEDAGFREWLADVEALTTRRTGLSIFDLPDCPYRDWYDQRLAASRASARAVRYAKE